MRLACRHQAVPQLRTICGSPLQKAEDLAHYTLLHWDMSELNPDSSTRRWMSWQGWLERAGARQFRQQDGMTFSDYNLLVQSAVAGHGIMVGSSALRMSSTSVEFT